MVLLRTSYRYGGFLEYYFKLQFSAFWSMIKLRHERMLILRCILPPKKRITSRKKINPRPPPEKSRTPRKETQVTGNILIHEKP